MKIHALRKTSDGDLTRISAKITWEDSDRPEQEIGLATYSSFANDLTCDPNAFLLAGAIPAKVAGEKRVLVEGKLCPVLRDGLKDAIRTLGLWYDNTSHSQIQIESTGGFEISYPKSPPRTGSFLSGGVDALAALRSNRLMYPLDHPCSISDGLLITHYGIREGPQSDDVFGILRDDSAFLTELASEANLTVIPVKTNFELLAQPGMFARQCGGSFLAFIAHAFSGRLSDAVIAASHFIDLVDPWGTHPLLDPLYSSSRVLIHHKGCYMTRIEKTKLLSEWPVALRSLTVCNWGRQRFQEGSLNCGECEKCIRTMMHLLYLDMLHECPTFSCDDLTAEHVLRIQTSHFRHFPNLIALMNEIDRADLAQALETVMLRAETGWRGKIKRLDQRFLDGRLLKAKRFVEK